MRITRTETCELPFILNLPDGTYSVQLNGAGYDLGVANGYRVLHFPDGRFAYGAPTELARQFGSDIARGRIQKLRTIVQHQEARDTFENDLPAVKDSEIMDDLGSGAIGEDPEKWAGRGPEIQAEGLRRFGLLTPEQVQEYRRRLGRQRIGLQLGGADRFLTALNALIRLYMVRFNDFFVEEVTLHQLAGQSPLTGVYIQIFSEQELLHHMGHVGKVPPLMRNQWYVHEQKLVTDFSNDLAHGVAPDSVALMEMRAKAFLERGATRSAVIEASAALELSVTRKLVAGFKKQGMSNPAIDAKLDSIKKFNQRANGLLHDATGAMLSTLDNALYKRVLDHRETYRHKIAHSDAEPPHGAAEAAVNDFAALRRVVDSIAC